MRDAYVLRRYLIDINHAGVDLGDATMLLDYENHA